MKYSTKEKEKKVFAVVAAIIFLAMVALLVLEIAGVFDAPTWRPVAEYPFVNQHVVLRGWNG